MDPIPDDVAAKARERVAAPFTAEQARSLNTFQQRGEFHSFTCGGGGGPCSGQPLTAIPGAGWVCLRCNVFAQDWAWRWMADWSWRGDKGAVPVTPLPAGEVTLFASCAGEEIREQMEGVHPAVCKDCRCDVHADTKSVRKAALVAAAMNAGAGAPVSFVCRRCMGNYAQPGRPGVSISIDDRPGGGTTVTRRA